MHRNIVISYILSFCRNSWFWMGIWVFYYLHITNYAGIGLVETAMIIAFIMSEIPTGLMADLVGRKKTLFVSFLLLAFGTALLTMAKSVTLLAAGAFVAGVGGSFYSGTLESLVYDTLLEHHEEKKYDKSIATVNSIALIAPAICGLIGGYLYSISISLPFLLSTLGYIAAIPFLFFIAEPKREKAKVSLQNVFQQPFIGFQYLFKNEFMTRQTIFLFSIGFVAVICLEMLNDFLGVEFGFNPTQLAVLWSVLYILCALGTQSVTYLKKVFSYQLLAILTGLLIAVSLIVSPVGGLLVGGITIGIRSIVQSMYLTVSSVLINQHTESTYRATTLSSFNLLKHIPYVLTAFFLGSLADKSSAITMAFVLGGVLLFVMLLQVIFFKFFPVKQLAYTVSGSCPIS